MKKILVIGIIGLFLVLGVSTVSADETGAVGAVVVYDKNILMDCNVTFTDINSETHEMPYQEIDPGNPDEGHAYIARDVPAGSGSIKVFKEGFKTQTNDEVVIFEGEYIEYLFNMEKIVKTVSLILSRFCELFLNAFPILMLLLKL